MNVVMNSNSLVIDQASAAVAMAEETIHDSFETLQGRVFATKTDCRKETDAVAEAKGFNVAVRRASNPQRCEPGEYLTFDLECTRSRHFESAGRGKRSRGFVRSGCPWSGRMSYYKKRKGWQFSIKNDTHNHRLCAEDARHEPIRRRRQRSGSLQKLAEELLDMPGCSAIDVAEMLEKDKPGTVVYPRDVLNLKKRKI